MKSKTFLVQANNHTPQVITCSITDKLLRNFPVSVVFFYRKSIDYNLLVDALKKILSDFPIFAGTLTNINNNLCIDCNNKGILFSITKEDCTLEQVLNELLTIKKEKLVNTINPKNAISSQSPTMTIKLTYFTCGGMALGICWHHVIGDMHTFMCLMKAWSNTVKKKEYLLPLIVKERDKYLEENFKNHDNGIPGVIYLNTRKLLKLVFYLLFPARNQIALQIYFSENELKNMKQDFLAKTEQNLSTNDVLCAYLFSIISELDSSQEPKQLSIAVNYRSRINLPQNILGNFISIISVTSNQILDPFQLAKDLRTSLENFQSLHVNFWSTKKFIEQNGGIRKIDRFIDTNIDPFKKNLLITNWSNFGVYNITFGESEPIYFTPFGDSPFPWLSVIVEGFSNNGLVYSVALPSKLAKKLIQEDNLRKIHKYRDQKEVMPELIEKFRWVL